jgi:hypothetical protein
MGNRSCGAVEGDIHRRSIHRWPQQDVPASLRISAVVFFLALEIRHRPVAGIRGKPTGRHDDAKLNERRIVADSAWFHFEQALAGTIRIGGERCLFGRS